MEQASGAARGYRFGVFELDVGSGELRRRGLKVRLRGRPVDILLLLLSRRGELVTRDELRSALWSADTFVDFDHGLNSAMNKLRDALGDAAERSRYIETVPRRGYRFVAPVDVVTDAAAVAAVNGMPAPLLSPGPLGEMLTSANVAPAALPGPQPPSPTERALTVPTPPAAPPQREVRSRWTSPRFLLLLAVVAVTVTVGAFVWGRGRGPATPTATARRVMLVVLPFENLSGGSDQDYFTDGITDDTIAQLGAIDAARLGVIARTTSMQVQAFPEECDGDRPRAGSGLPARGQRPPRRRARAHQRPAGGRQQPDAALDRELRARAERCPVVGTRRGDAAGAIAGRRRAVAGAWLDAARGTQVRSLRARAARQVTSQSGDGSECVALRGDVRGIDRHRPERTHRRTRAWPTATVCLVHPDGRPGRRPSCWSVPGARPSGPSRWTRSWRKRPRSARWFASTATGI